MQKPTLKLTGRELSMCPVTMRLWREITKADTVTEETTLAELLASRVHILALAYGVGEADLDGLPVEDVLPAYREAARYVNELVFSKLEKMPKNAGEGTGE